MIEDFYTETFTMRTKTTSTGWGVEPGWSTAVSTHKGAINPVRANERFSADKQFTFADYKLFCSSTVPITEANRLTWSGKNFNVIFGKNTLNMGHHIVAYLKNNNA